MSFATVETSEDQGQPVELYQFRYGPDDASYYGYTNHEEDLTVAGKFYRAIPISRNGIVSAGSLDKSELIISVGLTTEIAELFRVYPPGFIVGVTIFQGHLTDGNYQAIWLGRARGATRNKQADVSCTPVSSSLNRVGLRRHYQLGCPYALYSLRCAANKAVGAQTVVPVSFDSDGIRLPSGWNAGYARSDFIAGYVEWTAVTGLEARSILRIAGETLVISGPPSGLVASQAVTVYLGCNHLTSDCENLHNNIVNYGGQKYIPTENPIGKNPFN